jgi:hypothetical protein
MVAAARPVPFNTLMKFEKVLLERATSKASAGDGDSIKEGKNGKAVPAAGGEPPTNKLQNP